MKELTDLQKRTILAPIIANKITEEALNENFGTISEMIFKIGEDRVIELLDEEEGADYAEYTQIFFD